MSDRTLFILVFSGIWCLVGAVFLAVGLVTRRSWLRREERLRARASGTVTEVVRRENRGQSGNSVAWYPIVDFEADGRRISLECDEGGGRKTFYEGQRVEVLFDPDDPTRFRLEGRDAMRLMSRVMLAVGLGCVAIGVVAALIVCALPGGLQIDMR